MATIVADVAIATVLLDWLGVVGSAQFCRDRQGPGQLTATNVVVGAAVT